MNLPDPKCKDCKGTGEITLLIKTVMCSCVIQAEDNEIVIINEDFIDKRTNWDGI